MKFAVTPLVPTPSVPLRQSLWQAAGRAWRRFPWPPAASLVPRPADRGMHLFASCERRGKAESCLFVGLLFVNTLSRNFAQNFTGLFSDFRLISLGSSARDREMQVEKERERERSKVPAERRREGGREGAGRCL